MTKDILKLLRLLKDQDARLSLEAGVLKLNISTGKLTDEISHLVKIHNDELIDLLNQKNRIVGISNVSTNINYSLSSAQRRLWVLSQFEEGNVAYNMPANIVLDGSYDVKSFKRSVEAVIDRHEILRTVFKEDDKGEVRQWIMSRDALGFKIDYHDYSDDEEKEKRIATYIQSESVKAFDLSRGPLIRTALLRLSEDQYVFYYNMHHIISDGWSMEVLAKDIDAYYEFFTRNKPLILPGLRIQYKDYAAWQLAQIETDHFKEHKNYWLDKLSGELPVFELPTTKKRPLLKTNSGQTLTTYINKSVTRNLKTYCYDRNGTLFMGLVASLNVLFYRYTYGEEFIIGTPIAGREHADLENQIGFYVNTLALRTKVKGEESFDELFGKVKQNTLDAYTHQMYPFDRLVEDLNLKRDTSRSALFDVLVVLQNQTENKKIDISADSTSKIKELTSSTSKFDITFTFQEQGDYLLFGVEYNTDIYEELLMRQFIEHYKLILGSLLDSPTSKVGTVNYLGEDEKKRVLIEFNDTAFDYKPETVMELFEFQVSKTPDAVAVIVEEETFTYKEINDRSNQLANYLRERYGVSAKDNVGVMLERSCESVIAMIGVMKSGACYVPIDYKYPEERIGYILKDAGIELMVTQKSISDRSFMAGKKLIDIEEGELKEQSTKNPKAVNTPGEGSFVIYTSGSTGNPKGVVQTHRMMTNLIQWDIHHSGIKTGLRHLQYASFSFDASLHDIYFALSSGGSVYVVNDQNRMDYGLLKKEILNKKLEVLSFPYSALSAFLNQNDPESFAGHTIKYIVSTAEQLYVNGPLQRFLELNPEVELHNHYGPSESHVVTSHSMSLRRNNIVYRSSLGKPISNTDIYILDGNLNPVPVLVRGELYIGGKNLANGYLNKLELTLEKFIENPFRKGELMYKTGDLGRWQSDCTIEFIGRNDGQVKVRGYRIELSEIELALQMIGKVKESVVILKGDENGEKNLVSYVVSEEELNSSDLRNALAKHLPEYMIPSYFVQLEELPLTSNGKIDKKSLPDPLGRSMSSGTAYVAPGNETEQKLVEIWQDLLGREQIGIKDNFFELGGHSLKATRLVSMIYKVLEVKLGLKEIFLYPVLEEQALLIRRSSFTSYKEIEKVAISVSYPLSSAQQRLWVLSQFEGGSVAYNMPAHLLLDGSYDIESFKRSVEAVIDRHEILRTVFKEDERGEVRQWILSREELGFKIDYHDYSGDAEKEKRIEEYIERESLRAFDLSSGPLVRTGLLQLSSDQYVFYYNMHHIISDGWSMEVLARDVVAYYESFKENTALPLSELRIQYKDYAAWQLAQRETDHFKEHQKYWLDKFKGELPVLDLYSRKQRPKIKTYNGHRLSTYIGLETTFKLKKYSQDKGGTLFMSLIAAFNILVYRYSLQNDIIIGTPIAGREHADLENQIGFYINTLALRNNVEEADDFHSLFEKVKQSTLDAYTHQMYPFDRLVEELDIQRDASRSALFDVMLALQNNDENDNRIQINKSKSEIVYDYGRAINKFDLDIIFQEQGGDLSLQMVYNTDVYEREMVETLINHYKQLLSALLENPQEKISQIDYLSEKEKEKLLYTFNNTKIDYPKDKTIVDLFSEQAVKNPANMALVFKEKNLTYKELDDLSNQLANYLQKNYKIKSNDLVGIKQERSEWMIISLLGVLKSGGAYVPIDVAYPKERIEYIEKDTKCKVCIDENEINEFIKNQEKYSTKKAALFSKPNDLAYVIYTSGSTGKPKGVMIEHWNLVNYIKWYTENFKIAHTDSTMAYARFGFDAFVGETLTFLTRGACVHIAPQELLLDIYGINRYYESNNITVAFLPTPVCQQFIHLKNRSLRCLTTGGDRLIQFIKNEYQLVNNYGPTETTVVSTTFNVNESSKNYPIGRPIYNTQIYILNESLNLLPLGIIGEMYIGGDGLARGYFNQEELTNEKFITNPFNEGEIIYKTGDLARWLPDGNIEFVGRKDDQVKVRGYRIELGEIEHALLKNKEIESAIVLCRSNQSNEKDIVAYITSKREQNVSDLRSYLKELLPEYMLPVYYVQLKSMPLTSNGKIDKKSLPDPMDLNTSMRAEYVEPRNEIERKLVSIWKELIGRDRIGIKDDFFEIGGNSIKMIKLKRKYKDEFKKEYPLKLFFENRTISEHQLIVQSSMELENESLLELNYISENKKNLILIPPVLGYSLLFEPFAKYNEFEFNSFSVDYYEIGQNTSIIKLSNWIAAMIKENPVFRSKKIYLLGYSMGATIAFEVAKTLENLKYDCELILVDRPPNKKEWIEKIRTMSAAELMANADEILNAYNNNLLRNDFLVDKNKIVEKNQILNEHYTLDRIKSNITYIEALHNNEYINGNEWQKYTFGEFKHYTIQTTHNAIFEEKNFEFIMNSILKN
jgi:amino acid adenylation domain-containing protein